MSAANILAGMDDRLNPIVVKELRQAVKSRVVLVALMLFLLVQLGILLLILFWTEQRNVHTVNLHAGRDIFEVLQGILLGTCMLLIPAYAGVRLAAEHSDTNVDLLFISTLRPRSIIAGKFLASVVLILLIFSACAPFMTFTYLLRGIDIPSILVVLALDFLTVLLGTQLAIFLGAVPANWGMKLMLGLFGLMCMAALFGYAMSGSILLLETGLGLRLDTPEFWLLAGGIVTAVLAAIGLLFTWSVAVVSPPSANRALPARLFLVAAWLVTGGVAALLTWRFRHPAPLYVWTDIFTLLLCGQILTSINERERWGVRVRRTIPRRWWLRGPAFLLYSGAAGGILFALLLLAVTIGLPVFVLWKWGGTASLPRYETEFRRNALAMMMAGLYAFDYCLTAVFLRRALLAGRLKPTLTWALALILWGLGFSLPYILLFLFDSEDMRTGQVDPWWHITNPFVTIFNAVWRDHGEEGRWFQLGSLWFLGLWATAAALACLPWAWPQLVRFRPPESKSVAA